MDLQTLLAEKKIEHYEPTILEIKKLRNVILRELQDALSKDTSLDGLFLKGYNAALQLCIMLMKCAGYRTTGLGHHELSIKLLLSFMSQKRP